MKMVKLSFDMTGKSGIIVQNPTQKSLAVYYRNKIRESHLMGFAGKVESEYLIETTINSMANNFEDPDIARQIAFVGKSALKNSYAHGVFNASCFENLISQGYLKLKKESVNNFSINLKSFVVENGKVWIVTGTDKLFKALEAYFAKKDST